MSSPKTLILKTAYASRSERSSLDLPTPNIRARKRASLPIVEAYADLIGRGGNINAMLASRQPAMNNMRNVYDGVSKPGMLYYEEQVQYQPSGIGGARDRTEKESPIVAELKTNVIVKDEFTLVTDLSYQLAARYNRPESAILIQVDHSACIALGGAFDPCYILTITAIPSQLSPKNNLRNAALIQQFMAEVLSVPASRGILKFHSIEEHNYATNGTTMAPEIDRTDKLHPSVNGTMSPPGRSHIATNHRKSLPSFKKGTVKTSDSMPMSNRNGIPELPYIDPGRKPNTDSTVTTPELYELPANNGDDTPQSAVRSHTPDSGVLMGSLMHDDTAKMRTKTPVNRSKTVPNPYAPTPVQQPAVSIQDELMAAPSPKVYRNASDKSRHNSSTTLGRKSIESVRPQNNKPEQKALASLLETSPARTPETPHSTRRRSTQNITAKHSFVDPNTRVNAASNSNFHRSPAGGAPTSKRDAYMNEKMRLSDAKTLYAIKTKPIDNIQKQAAGPPSKAPSTALPSLPTNQKPIKQSSNQLAPPPTVLPAPVQTSPEKGKRRRSFLSALRRTKTPAA